MMEKPSLGYAQSKKSKDGLMTCREGDDFVERYDKICQDNSNKEQEWIKRLKELGIKASHPDDGWHKREEYYFQFSYPHFNDDPQIGDMVALGDHESFRVFIVDDIKYSWLKRYYYLPNKMENR